MPILAPTALPLSLTMITAQRGNYFLGEGHQCLPAVPGGRGLASQKWLFKFAEQQERQKILAEKQMTED